MHWRALCTSYSIWNISSHNMPCAVRLLGLRLTQTMHHAPKPKPQAGTPVGSNHKPCLFARGARGNSRELSEKRLCFRNPVSLTNLTKRSAFHHIFSRYPIQMQLKNPVDFASSTSPSGNYTDDGAFGQSGGVIARATIIRARIIAIVRTTIARRSRCPVGVTQPTASVICMGLLNAYAPGKLHLGLRDAHAHGMMLI